jgi:hypothetical protein
LTVELAVGTEPDSESSWSYGILERVRRYVDLTRADFVRLLAAGPTDAGAACARAVRGGATFRVHQDTVTRQGALRIYALRAQTMQLERKPGIGVDEALKNLADSQFEQLRIAAVSDTYQYVVFMDPDCHVVVACLGIDVTGDLPFAR